MALKRQAFTNYYQKGEGERYAHIHLRRAKRKHNADPQVHPFTNKYARLATWSLVYIVSGTWVAYTIATAFQCVPLAFKWDKTIPGGRCFDVTAFAVSSSVPNIVNGIVIMILPVRTILDLKVSVGRKIGLGLIFLTGSVYVALCLLVFLIRS